MSYNTDALGSLTKAAKNLTKLSKLTHPNQVRIAVRNVFINLGGFYTENKSTLGKKCMDELLNWMDIAERYIQEVEEKDNE